VPQQIETKTTVSLCLKRKLLEKARIYSLNISRIPEQALSSILDYLDTQNNGTPTSSVKPFSEKGS
jgi:post-segregation antitoxin (ccd killing protein)